MNKPEIYKYSGISVGVFFGYFIYFHFICYPSSQFPLHKTPIFFPSPCLYEGALLPPSPFSLSSLSFPYPGSWSLHRTKGAPLLLMPDKDILFCISSWSHKSCHMHSLVGGLVPGSFGGSGRLILLFFLWGCKPAPSVLALTSPLGCQPSVQCLAACIHICIGQALAEPLRSCTRLLSASTSWHQQ